MSYCPSCRAEVAKDAETCPKCQADFTREDGWRPLEEGGKSSQEASGSMVGVFVKLGLASVLLPALGFALGLVASQLIPGCHCDEGAGCRGCGENDLLSFLLFGGFVGALGAVVTVLPVCLVIAALSAIFSSRRN